MERGTGASPRGGSGREPEGSGKTRGDFEMSTTWIAWVGYAGVAIVVIGWLVVSFSAPGPRRMIVEWIAACGLYLSLLSLFVNLCLRAQAAGSTPGLVGFGFLVALFGSGLVVSLVQTLMALRGPTSLTSSATH
jgi:hypothetical protein